MANSYFQFKEFRISQERSKMKVCTDSCLFGAWVARHAAPAKKILDIGSGTGLLSLMVMQAFPAASLTAIEIDREAAVESGQNFMRTPWADCMRVETIALQNFAVAANFDLVISNPPFYKNALPSPLALKSLAMHESSMALKQWLHKMSDLLSPDGSAALLLPFQRKDEVMNYAAEFQLKPCRIANVRQSDRHDFFRVMILFTKKDRTLVEEELLIRQEHEYSKQFVSLLKPYYLNL